MAYGGLDIGCPIAAHERHMRTAGWPTDGRADGLLGSIERRRDRGKEKPRRVAPGVKVNSGQLVTGNGRD